MSLMILAAATALAGAQDLSAYEGVARDDFAAWSFTSGAVTASGQTRTTSILTRYDTATPFNNNPTPVAYSIHRVSLDCEGKTVTWLSGANYSASGAEISPASPTGALPWTDGTPGFQQLAAQVCALDGSL